MDKSFIEEINKATQYLEKSHARSSMLRKEIRGLSQGKYTVANAIAIYKHDQKLLDELEKGKTFRAVHCYSAHSKFVLDENSKGYNHFRDYIDSHIDAKKGREIEIVRIYVFASADDIKEVYIKNMDKLHNSGIMVRVHYAGTNGTVLNPRGKVDMVIFGDELLGEADFSEEHINICYYTINSEANAHIFEEQIEKFDHLKKHSSCFVKIIEDEPKLKEKMQLLLGKTPICHSCGGTSKCRARN
jgi:hypothetical protein